MWYSTKQPLPSEALSPRLVTDLRAALRGKHLPVSLEHEIFHALWRYLDDRGDQNSYTPAMQRERRKAVDRVNRVALALREAMARADTAFEVEIGERRKTRFIYSSWHALEPALTALLMSSEAWLARNPSRRRGHPKDSARLHLRMAVLFALEDARILITKNATGTAAKVLLAVLEEADRVDVGMDFGIDGDDQDSRGDFNGKQWKQMLVEYEAVKRRVRKRYGARVFKQRTVSLRIGVRDDDLGDPGASSR